MKGRLPHNNNKAATSRRYRGKAATSRGKHLQHRKPEAHSRRVQLFSSPSEIAIAGMPPARRRRSTSREASAVVARTQELPVSASNPELGGFKGRLHTVKVRLLASRSNCDGWIAHARASPVGFGRPKSSSWKMGRASPLLASRSLHPKASAGALALPEETRYRRWGKLTFCEPANPARSRRCRCTDT